MPCAWVSKRSHLQISATHVLPVVFRTRARAEHAADSPAARLADAHGLILQWLQTNLDRVYRITSANTKPGTLATPDLVRGSRHSYTLSLEPTDASFSLLVPRGGASASREGDVQYDAFVPTPQTLHVTAERLE